jgi:hypothetical protein
MPYNLFVILTMAVIPIAAGCAETAKRKTNLADTLAKWFILCAVGIRLTTAGISQLVNPGFTAGLLGCGQDAEIVVRELGIANVIFGALAIACHRKDGLNLPGIAGGLFLALAGCLHLARGTRLNGTGEWIAMASDLWVLLLVAIHVARKTALGRRP